MESSVVKIVNLIKEKKKEKDLKKEREGGEDMCEWGKRNRVLKWNWQ